MYFFFSQKMEEETSFDEGIRLLKENGLIKEQPTGGYVIELTGKSVQLALPEHLREMPLELWNHEDRLWLNTYAECPVNIDNTRKPNWCFALSILQIILDKEIIF